MSDVKDEAIKLFVQRFLSLKSTEIKWPKKMNADVKLMFLDNLIELSQMNGDIDDCIKLNQIKRKIK